MKSKAITAVGVGAAWFIGACVVIASLGAAVCAFVGGALLAADAACVVAAPFIGEDTPIAFIFGFTVFFMIVTAIPGGAVAAANAVISVYTAE